MLLRVSPWLHVSNVESLLLLGFGQQKVTQLFQNSNEIYAKKGVTGQENHSTFLVIIHALILLGRPSARVNPSL